MDLIVIGAGLAGLSTGYYAKKSGKSVLILEPSARSGGVIRTERAEGFLLEVGPNTVQMTPELFELVRELKLEAELEIADARTPRYVLFDGKLHEVPMSPAALLSTSLLSIGGKLRLLKEPLVPKRKDGGDETLLSYTRRRLGAETAERLVAPFVSGVWAGDAAQLSASASFPKLAEWEEKYGSLIMGALFSPKKKSAAPRGLFSFKNGIETLTRAMADSLKSEIKTNITVKEIRRDGGEWILRANGLDARAKEIFICAPAPAAAALITPFAQEAAYTLNQTPYAGVAVLHLGFKEDQIKRRVPGFGFLCAPSEKSDILGCLWNSQLFPRRAPEGSVLWTVFMGGLTNQKILEQPDAALIERAVAALRPLMGLDGNPTFTRLTRHNKAIPQYTLGHAERMRVLGDAERKNPGLRFAANYRGGISVGDVVKSASLSINL